MWFSFVLCKPFGVRLLRPSLVNIVLAFALLGAILARRRTLGLMDVMRMQATTPEWRATPIHANMTPASPSPSSLRTPLQVIYEGDKAAAARRARALPACAAQGTRARSFLMVFMGHSGSSAILSEVREHPDVHMNVMELVDHQESSNTTAAAETTRLFFEAGIRNGKLPGFKIRPYHLLTEPALFRNLVREYDTRIIWQYRKNIIKASVGEYAVRYLRDSRSVEGLRENLSEADRCSHAAGCSFPIHNVGFLHAIMKRKVHSHNVIVDAVHSVVGVNSCVREVPYEDYLYDREATMRDIFHFLGLPLRKTAPQRFKANGDNLCQVVENWQDVCRMFYGCITWQHMLDDVRNDCFCASPGGPTTFC